MRKVITAMTGLAIVLVLALAFVPAVASQPSSGDDKRAYCHATSDEDDEGIHYNYLFNSAWTAHFQNNGTPKAGHELDFYTVEGDDGKHGDLVECDGVVTQPTATVTRTSTATKTATPTNTSTATATLVPSATATPTPTNTPTPTVTQTGTLVPSATPTNTATATLDPCADPEPEDQQCGTATTPPPSETPPPEQTATPTRIPDEPPPTGAADLATPGTLAGLATLVSAGLGWIVSRRRA